MKILNIIGARPNFVKIAPLIDEMRKLPGIAPVLVHTGQHFDREMSDSFFRDLDIPRPDHHLHVKPGSPASQVRKTMSRLAPVLATEQPDVVLVVGDVNSTLAGALTALKFRIPVVHVEAGLRSFDRTMPEEGNRLVTDAVSDLLFVSEPSGVENLLREGRPKDHIFLVGNVMIDTLKRALARLDATGAAISEFAEIGHTRTGRLRYAVLTLHRQGLVDDPVLFRKTWSALKKIGHRIPIVFPVHPRTRMRFKKMGFRLSSDNGAGKGSRGIHMIPPLGYMEFLRLQKEATFVLTDSGGVQEETTALGVPCLTLRENTERPFTVTNGTNKIVGLDPAKIRREVDKILAGKAIRRRAPSLWDGHAAERIVRILCEHFPVKAEMSGRPNETATPTSYPPISAR